MDRRYYNPILLKYQIGIEILMSTGINSDEQKLKLGHDS